MEHRLDRPLHIVQDAGLVPLHADALAALHQIAAQVACVHSLPDAVQLVLIDDDYMSDLNTTYRSKEGTTDVLSFDLGTIPGQDSSGEVYVSLPQAQRQAAALCVPPLVELARLLVHGLLHLAGWVHNTPEQLAAMERETDRFLTTASPSL
ncbi:MAG: rRNA maturation RNase YbeY [Gemmatimonadetes bacterium]|nr:rRNA maturation RNase YbeY [Gemmatimonadota bacterium]